ncbi:hypothetical protein ACP70R_012038 [Stipagrostis hirtigluma subsp. patula]
MSSTPVAAGKKYGAAAMLVLLVFVIVVAASPDPAAAKVVGRLDMKKVAGCDKLPVKNCISGKGGSPVDGDRLNVQSKLQVLPSRSYVLD